MTKREAHTHLYFLAGHLNGIKFRRREVCSEASRGFKTATPETRIAWRTELDSLREAHARGLESLDACLSLLGGL